jgi:hypothetical protein
MKHRSYLLLAAGLVVGPLGQAAIFSVSETLGSGNTINDPTDPGLARVLTVSTPVQSLTDLSITLDLGSADGSTAWNSDLYVQLSSPSGVLAVLINRTGLTPGDGNGYGDAGFQVTINDGAADDIHTYQTVSYTLNGSGQLTGTWKSDGRADALGATRSSALAGLLGTNPNGAWTLLVADLGSGNLAKLNGWSIDGVGTTVPEPAATAAFAGLAALAVALCRRARISR